MLVAELIGPEQVALDVRVRDKAQLVGELARRAAALTGLEAEAIATALLERERLGSTGLGRGFALPHARIAGLRSYGSLFLRLARPVAFDAVDEQPVDLVFLLLIPPNHADQHVAALAAIARVIRNKEVADGLRKADSAEAAYARLCATL